ncbi:MAG: glycoside hydrolase family 66 protein [Armatimonadota bacterium]|nr:glycoside hydrolase family 66 protein [Armatimonadota bacterium]
MNSPLVSFHIFFLLLFLAACCPAQAGPLSADIGTDRAAYTPRMPVHVSIALSNATGHRLLSGIIRLSCTHLGLPVSGPPRQSFRLAPGAKTTLAFHWQPPVQDFQGYLVEAEARDLSGRLLAAQTTAVDVSSAWTRFPRYGFVSQFSPQSPDASRRIIYRLNRYHLNSLQFYDWQYKHHHPLAGTVTVPAASWHDIANRPTSRRTILDLITAAHGCGMAAMNYNLLYGAWTGYGNEGVDFRWGLWKNKDGTRQDSLGLPPGWAAPTLYLFNPGDAGWQRYLIGQEASVFAAYPFDGWQADQLGDRGEEYDVHGNPVTVRQQFRPFLNRAKESLHKAIVFNNVGAYGLYDTSAHSTEDAVYVECWEFGGQKTYGDLKTMIDQAAQWSGGKSVILAAYMDRVYSDRFSAQRPGHFALPGVLLADAAIFASGGAHIELGDGDALLDNEYFPNRNLTPTPALLSALRHDYDFQVAYENLLRGGLSNSANAIALNGLASSPDAAPDTVWAFAKAGPSVHILHLINLIGEKDTSWRDDHADYPAPTPQINITVKYYLGSAAVKAVRWASPDTRNGAASPLKFIPGTDKRGRYVQFTVPRLDYWDMIWLTVA